jgi:hypothetical protein
VQDRGQTADNNELDFSVAQGLYRSLELHQRRLRAAPRTSSNAVEAAFNLAGALGGRKP